ncbi:uncharacterized protein LOC131945894 isoform X2 [Physella acuta]|uniref:uncharacterized protein LOC131945894 isoform X2 n=1 Tax=Physella acuta TaxID=109671 RepID=UPI0027DBEEFD|nr:uncharacterized protein LOC131945894 isoform X2 [Physella acuta]
METPFKTRRAKNCIDSRMRKECGSTQGACSKPKKTPARPMFECTMCPRGRTCDITPQTDCLNPCSQPKLTCCHQNCLLSEDPNLNPYVATATGYLGVQRTSMLQNPLLYRHRLGQGKWHIKNLPCDDFIFGSLPQPSGSVAQALSSWSEDKPPVLPCLPKKKIGCTNHLALNRAAITAGIANVKELRDFRNTHSIKFTKRDKRLVLERAPPVSLLPGACFGQPTKYTSTVGEIISYQAHRDWVSCVKPYLTQIQEEPSKPDPWKENNAYKLRMFNTSANLKPERLWQMSKFVNKAKPEVSTFRSTNAMLASHNANTFEKIGRDGMFGQGIPTVPVNRRDALAKLKA